MPHVISSETGMEVQRLMDISETAQDLMGQVRWRGFSASKDTEESLKKMYEDVPELIKTLLCRDDTSLKKSVTARREN